MRNATRFKILRINSPWLLLLTLPLLLVFFAFAALALIISLLLPRRRVRLKNPINKTVPNKTMTNETVIEAEYHIVKDEKTH